MPQEDQWQEWAGKAQAGDQRAYAALLKDLSPYIRNVIMRSLANPDWADEITQNTLISIHKSLYTYSPDRPFRPWLMAIVNFRRTDYLRRHYANRGNKQVSLENADFENQNVTEQPPTGELKDIEEALGTLPRQQQDVFRLMKVEGYTAQEVADKLGMTESAVKVSAHRTINKLKSKLK